MAMTAAPVSRSTTKLNANQIKGFWAAWAGWTLDGMDAFIYALVLVPALTELLPRSGLAVTPGNVGYYGSLLQALFLFGWGLAMVWGPIADRFGRVRTERRIPSRSETPKTEYCHRIPNSRWWAGFPMPAEDRASRAPTPEHR
jgi:hypothetical protein